MKSDYRVRAIRFLKQVYPYLDFNNPCDCADKVSEYNYRYSRKVFVSNGSARIALITSDYVIKYDYNEWAVKQCGGCEDEISFYNFAKEEGFAHLFAEITLFEYRGHKFYIMPRINGIGKYRNYVQSYLNRKDLTFIQSYMYDMHKENYGWKNGYPVIVDYAFNVFFEERKKG